MKKLISLILCTVLVCLSLTACKKEEIGDYLKNYTEDKREQHQVETLNLYIITGDNTSAEAILTVPQNINTYLKEKYKIELNIEYFKESEYQAGLATAMSSTNEAERPDIILINGVDMFLNYKDSLLPLNKGEFNFFGTDYKSLNTIVDDALLAASAIDGTYYAVPNNHAIGYYEYIVISKEAREYPLYFSPEKLSNMTTEESLDELKAKIVENGLNVDDYIKVIANNEYDEYDDYEDFEYLKKTALENIALGNSQVLPGANDSEINYVNIMSYPVATSEEAFLSAFAIVKSLDDPGTYVTEEIKAPYKNHYSKCMSIIYALNTDTELRNMLQYGYVGTNYNYAIDDVMHEIIPNRVELVTASNRYDMNLIYTGNAFISNFCYEMGWDEKEQENWLKQNADAKAPTAEEQIAFEIADLGFGADVLPDVNLPESATLDIFTRGFTFIDVDVNWTSSSESVVIDLENRTLTTSAVTEDTVVVITVEFVCQSVKVEKSFNIILTAPAAG